MSKESKYDGGIRFRCPEALKRKIEKLADERHTSVAQLCREAMAREVEIRKGK